MPDGPVLMEALNLYQTELRKPSFTIYCLDYSGSMSGTGREQLVEAMGMILIQEQASQYLLQANEQEINGLVLFDETILQEEVEEQPTKENLEGLYQTVEGYSTAGGTDIDKAAIRALETMGG